MNKKFIYSAIVLLLAISLVCSFSFATTNNTMVQNVANGAKNVINSAENTIENAAGDVSNTAKNITAGAEKAGNTVGDTIMNGVNDITKDNPNNTTNSNYTANRTATTADTSNFLGMNATTWIWLIIGIAALGIGILIYSYFNQKSHYEHSDE